MWWWDLSYPLRLSLIGDIALITPYLTLRSGNSWTTAIRERFLVLSPIYRLFIYIHYGFFLESPIKIIERKFAKCFWFWLPSSSPSTRDSWLCSSYSRESPCGNSGEMISPSSSLHKPSENDEVKLNNGREGEWISPSLLPLPLVASSSGVGRETSE